MQLYIEGMCADEVDERIFINGQKLLASGQEVRSTHSGCPQWEVPRVGTPAPRRCRQLGYTGEAEWCPDASSWASSQTRRCQASEEMRGPPRGRAQEGRRQPPGEINGSRNKIECVLRQTLGE
jgi:hypothetical protein